MVVNMYSKLHLKQSKYLRKKGEKLILLTGKGGVSIIHSCSPFLYQGAMKSHIIFTYHAETEP